MRIKTIFFTMLILTGTVLFSQEKDSPMVKVEGTGKLQVTPDVGVLNLHLSTIQMNFGEAIDSLTAKETSLYEQLQALGYKRENVKSIHYNVSENRVYTDRGSYDSGYVASQLMTLEFTNNQKEIARLINSFATGSVDAGISFHFKLSDSLIAKKEQELIQMALDDARRKGQVIAASTDLELGKIAKIEYSDVPVRVYERSESVYDMNQAFMSQKQGGTSTGFTVQDIPLSDEILVWYELE